MAITSAQNTGGAGTDTASGFENLTGSAHNDVLTGSSGTNVINGGDGNDLIQGGGGNDILNGGNGSDTASYSSASSAVTVNLGTTTAQNTGGDGNDTLSNIENLRGSNYNDTLTGNSGNNVIEGGSGNDTLNGNGGIDTVSYASAIASTTVNLSTTTAQDTGGAGTDTITNFENIVGSFYHDTLTGNAAANVIDGGNGDDTLNGGAGADTLHGGDGTDQAIFSGDYSDYTLSLVSGSGTIQDNVGTDGIDTLSGIERLIFNDGIYENGIFTPNQLNEILGTSGNDTLYGTSGADVIYGLEGQDSLYGEAGNDELYGGSGNDNLDGGNGTNLLDGGDGKDEVNYWYVSNLNINLSTGVATHNNASDTLVSIEDITSVSDNAYIVGSNADNSLNNYGYGLTVYGLGGEDLIQVYDEYGYFYGGDDDDKFYIYNDNYSSYGGYGFNSFVDGGAGYDTLEIRDGSTSLSVNLLTGAMYANGVLQAQADYNSIEKVVLAFGTGSYTLYDDNADNTFVGGDMADTLIVRQGDDTLYGYSGDDVLEYHFLGNTSDFDLFYGNTGDDTVRLYFSQSEYTQAVQDEISLYQNFLITNSNTSINYGNSFSFSEFNLTLDAIENVEVYVDGVIQNPGGGGGGFLMAGGGLQEQQSYMNFSELESSRVVLFSPKGSYSVENINGMKQPVLHEEGNAVADTFMFGGTRYENGQVDVLEHFNETEGDRLDFSGIFSEEHPLDGLISDYIQATENNGHTIISIDKDGLGMNYQFQDAVVLTNTTNIDIEDLIDQGKVFI